MAHRRLAQRVTIAHGGRNYKVKLPLVGAFQVQERVVAAGLAIATRRRAGARLRALNVSPAQAA